MNLTNLLKNLLSLFLVFFIFTQVAAGVELVLNNVDYKSRPYLQDLTDHYCRHYLTFPDLRCNKRCLKERCQRNCRPRCVITY